MVATLSYTTESPPQHSAKRRVRAITGNERVRNLASWSCRGRNHGGAGAARSPVEGRNGVKRLR